MTGKEPFHPILTYRTGFTLVELMVVTACLMLCIIPAWKIFHQGTKSSLTGMLQVETTMEARKVLRQVGNDLKNSCWDWGTAKSFYSLYDIVSTSGSFPNKTFSFNFFPNAADTSSLAPVGSNWETNQFLYRKISRVTYRLQTSPKIAREGYPSNLPMYALIREEQLHPDNNLYGKYAGGLYTKTISERVMMFDISPYQIKDQGDQNQHMAFWITLQLIDTADRSGNVQVNMNATSNKLAQRSKDLVIADFFDLVIPTYYISYRRNAGPKLGIRSTYDRASFFDPRPTP